MNPSILRRRGRATAILTTAFVALPFAPAAIAQPIDVPGLPGLPGIGEAAAPGLGDALEPGINAAVGANDAIAGAVNSARATGLPEDAIDPGVADRIILAPTADATSGVTVTFLSDASSASVEYRDAQGAAGSVATTIKGAGASASHHTATIGGLQPGTAYEYRIVAGDGADQRTGQWRTFATAAASGPMDIIFWGDAQNGLADEWAASAQAAIAGVPNASLMLQSGDMIDQAHSDEEWGQWYRSMGDAAATTPLLTALGNHELTIDPAATAFRNHFTHPANGPASLNNSTYYVDHQGVRIITLTANALFLDDQAAFLEEALAGNPHEWSMVMFHQPVHNGTTNRNDTTYGEAFTEIIERHDVDLVLNGHDHTYARGHKTDNVVDGVNTGPVYLVATAGSKYYPTAAENPAWSGQGAERAVWASNTSSYQRITLDACTMEVTSVITTQGDEPVTSIGAAGAGDILDEFTIDKCGDGKQVTDGN